MAMLPLGLLAGATVLTALWFAARPIARALAEEEEAGDRLLRLYENPQLSDASELAYASTLGYTTVLEQYGPLIDDAPSVLTRKGVKLRSCRWMPHGALLQLNVLRTPPPEGLYLQAWDDNGVFNRPLRQDEDGVQRVTRLWRGTAWIETAALRTEHRAESGLLLEVRDTRNAALLFSMLTQQPSGTKVASGANETLRLPRPGNLRPAENVSLKRKPTDTLSTSRDALNQQQPADTRPIEIQSFSQQPNDSSPTPSLSPSLLPNDANLTQSFAPNLLPNDANPTRNLSRNELQPADTRPTESGALNQQQPADTRPISSEAIKRQQREYARTAGNESSEPQTAESEDLAGAHPLTPWVLWVQAILPPHAASSALEALGRALGVEAELRLLRTQALPQRDHLAPLSDLVMEGAVRYDPYATCDLLAAVATQREHLSRKHRPSVQALFTKLDAEAVWQAFLPATLVPKWRRAEALRALGLPSSSSKSAAVKALKRAQALCAEDALGLDETGLDDLVASQAQHLAAIAAQLDLYGDA